MPLDSLENAYNYVGQRHITFTEMEDRWQFLLESYQGGESYREGQHLTKYVLETPQEYQARLRNTPLDNHCRSVISVYVSFLFRETARRDLSGLENLPDIQDFLRDADLDGRSLDACMKEVSIWSSVFGHAWILMTKPDLQAQTQADQLAQGVRPYINILTPMVVTDWAWSRQPNGRYDLVYFKYIEDVNDSITTIREWYPDRIVTWSADSSRREAEITSEEINGLGRIPAVLCYNQRSQVRGLGISDIDDIADMQRAIYNELSEVEQSIRLEGHPSLVVTPDTQIGSGAGALIQIPENLDPGLRPYVLNIDAAAVSSIYESIKQRVDAIDRMANTGGVRATETREISGVAMETEFQLLNAKLSEKASNLALAEEQMWRLYAEYQGQIWQGSVVYPSSFNLRDTGREIEQLRVAREVATDPVITEIIDRQLITLLGEDPEEYLSDAVDLTQSISSTEVRTYPNGEPIDPDLPEAYQPADAPGVPAGQNCENCAFYDSTLFQCSQWNNAAVRPMYWCRAWQGE